MQCTFSVSLAAGRLNLLNTRPEITSDLLNR